MGDRGQDILCMSHATLLENPTDTRKAQHKYVNALEDCSAILRSKERISN